MKARNSFVLCACVPAWLVIVLSTLPVRAQADKKDDKAAPEAESKKVIPDVPIDDPGALGTQGDEFFAKGEWMNAAAHYNGLVTIGKKLSLEEAKFEPLRFIIGVCMYNIPNYDEALKWFQEYTQKHPTGQRVHQVNLAIARVFRQQKKWAEAIKQYKPLLNVATLKEDVLIELADAQKENQEKDKAIITLETALAAGMKTAGDVRAALYLVDLYSEDKPEKGVGLLERVKNLAGARAVISEINFAALKLADGLMSDEKFDQALVAYQSLRKKDEVLRTLKKNQEGYANAIKVLTAKTGAKDDPRIAVNLQTLDRMRVYEAQAKMMLTEIEKLPNYDAEVFYRIGRCFAALNRFWEAKVALEYVLKTFPTFAEKANVMYLLAYCYYSLSPQDSNESALAKELTKQAEDTCKAYLKEFKDKAEASNVSDMIIQIVARSKDPVKISQAYDELMDFVKGSPNGSTLMAHQVQFYLEQYEPDKARDSADKFLSTASADDPMREAVEYMRGLTWFFKNDYKGSTENLGAYLKKYPTGQFLPDVRYRLAFLKKGEEMARKSKKMSGDPRFRSVIEACEGIIKDYADKPSVADAWALIGDCYKEMTGAEVADMKSTRAEVDIKTANAFIEAVRFATQNSKAESVAEYGLTQVAPMLKAQGRWAELRQMYEWFYENFPDHRISLQAVNEISKAIVRDSDNAFSKELEEAQVAKNEAAVKRILEQRSAAKEEAQKKSREFLAATIKENINNPQKEGVEELMQQLALAAVPKKKRELAPVVTAPPEGTPTTPPKKPEPPSVEEQGKAAEAELDRLLTESMNNIGKARHVYVKALLYQDLESRQPRKKGVDGKYVEDKSPKRSDALLKQLTDEFRVADYSSALLALVGDLFYKEGDTGRARECWNRLLTFFPKSLFLDWAAVGLGDLAMKEAEPNYPEALKYYTLATDEFIGSKFGEALLGKARVQFFTGKLEEAENSVKDILKDKSFPPEQKAEATWIMGEIKFQQKALPDAFNFFQRLYLSYKKFPDWSCKGYLRAGQTKEEMGKNLDAKAVYAEAADDPKNAERFKGLQDFEKLKLQYNGVK